MRTQKEILQFLKEISNDVYIPDYINIEDIDINNPFESIRQMIENNGGFDIEIIYYENAIQFLKENDDSLMESLELAHELGYQVNQLNSEILASLLASKRAREEFDKKRNEIENFFKGGIK